jgi:hypothetical protein
MPQRISSRFFTVFVLFLACPRPATSESPEAQAADEARIVAAVVKVLPKNWNLERTSTGVALRPNQQPLFVNFTNAEPRRPGESRDDYLRRHVVHFDYCITMEFARKIEPSRVQEMIAQNAAIDKKIKEIQETAKFAQIKGVPMPETPEEARLVAEYRRLMDSLNRIPCGYLGDTSVYIRSTELGYARFFSQAAKEACETVRSRVAGVLSPY